MTGRARVQLEPGHILNARPYRDSSLLLEIFTATHGRIGLVARGARSARSKMRVLLQPFQPLLLSWTLSGELGTLTGAEGDTRARASPLSGERVFYGWYLNELVLKLLARADPHPALYERYAAALGVLATDAAEAALRIFEKHLLAEIGYGLHLPDGLRADVRYRYDDERGFVEAAAEGGFPGASLIALRDEAFEAGTRAFADARTLLRPLIERQLAGQRLSTPQLLREMRALESERKNGEKKD